MKVKVKVRKIVTLLLAVLLIWQLLPAQVLSEGEPVTHTVNFLEYDGETTLKTVHNVPDGTRLDTIQPDTPERTGYTFVQWTPPETYITGDQSTTFDFTAQYRSTYLYELNIKYQYENGSPAALSYMATYAYGEEYEVESPLIQGFYIDPPADEIISGTAGITQNGATELNYTVTYKASTGTPYTVEHYLQNIYDDGYTLDPNRTENFAATTGSQVTVAAQDIPGFTAQTPTQEATIAPDGSTVVKMYYDRISYILTYDTAGGSFIPPFQARYGAAITAPANPTRTGYTFAGWSSPIPQTLTESQTITAAWTAHTNVNYTLVYWIEDADPIPGTNTYEYSYHSSATRTGTAGTVYTIPATDKKSISYFTYHHNDTGVVIAGDGSTVINIYYERNSYTVEFDLDRRNATMTIGGVTYSNSGPNYSFTAKYESNITHLWPTKTNIPDVWSWGIRYRFLGWYHANIGRTLVSKRITFTEDLFNTVGTRVYTGQWTTGGNNYDLHYFYQSLTGTGERQYNNIWFNEDQTLRQDAIGTGNWYAKTLSGLTSYAVTVDSSTGGDDDYDVYFYYLRNIYTLDFYSYNQVVPGKSQNLMYGASILPGYNFTPETPADLPEHSFGGWYTTPDATPGTEFDWSGATMPSHNLRLFAKWIPPQYTVRFFYTAPDGTVVQHATQQVVQGQKAVRPEEPAVIPGYDFDGWYYSGTLTKYVFDAQVFNSLDLTGRYLPKNDRTYTVRYLHTNDTQAADPKTVTGQTTGTTVTEQAVEVPGFLPDAQIKTLTLQGDNNVITFYYSAPNVDYTVRYLARDTGVALLDPATKNNGGHVVVTEEAPVITNRLYQLPDNSWVIVDFTPDLPQKSLYLTSNPDLNIITFYYEYIVKNHYEVRYLEEGTDVILAEPKHVISGKSEVVELSKEITNYRPHSVSSTYQDLVRSSSANYISTALGVSDPVNQDPQVITFYYAPEHIEIEGDKTWVDDQNAQGERPTFHNLPLSLYANGTLLTTQPTPQWTDKGNVWTYRYINLPAAVGGVTQYYTVQETVPAKYVVAYSDKTAPGGTDITNTLDGGTTEFSGTKTWVDNVDPSGTHPEDLGLVFYRKGHNDTDYVKMNPQPVYSWNKDTGVINVWAYTATGLKEYEAGYPVLYKAKEIVPDGYAKTSDNGEDFTNEIVYTTATKNWVDGPAERPIVWFKIYRQVGVNGAPEPVPGAPIKMLDGITEVSWRGLKQTDADGNPYIFSVREVDVNGNDFTPPNYTKAESDLNVTNTYVIPSDGTATATKKWENGSPTHPDLWLQLWRKTTVGGIDQPVPLPNNAGIVKTNTTGDTSYTWTGLEETDINGNAYTFYVKEGQWDGTTFTEKTPETYELTGKDTLNLKNTYVIPTDGSLTATKEWVDGSQVAKPDVWFQIQRRIAGGTWAPVPNVDPLQIPTMDPYTVTWDELEQTDSAARPYEFGVIEGVYAGGIFTPGSPGPFVMTAGEYTDMITNTYVSPTISITVGKDWSFPQGVDGDSLKTEVTLSLMRATGGNTPVKVQDIVLNGIVDGHESPVWRSTITNLPERNSDGVKYTYSVLENDVPANFVASVDGYIVTNTWQATDFVAKKEWEGGYTNMLRPPVTFQLQRQTDGMAAPENVGDPVVLDGYPDDISVEKSGEHTAWIYTWKNLPKNDGNNDLYTYSVTETPLIGYTPSGPDNDNGVATITNTYVHVDINARKVINFPEGIPTTMPQFQLVLHRSDGWEDVVVLDGVNDDAEIYESGERDPDPVDPQYPNKRVWNYSWKYLPAQDANGDPYLYTLSEPNLPGGYVRVSITGDMNHGFEVTNEKRDDVFRAFKYWNTKTDTIPVTFQLWQVELDAFGEPVVGADPVNMGMDVTLNGIVDSEESPSPNNADYHEDAPWCAVWFNLPTQTGGGASVKYQVQEEPFDLEYANKYEIDATSSASTAVTNVSLYTDVTAKKLWVGGENVRPGSVTLTLSRYLTDGETLDTESPQPQPAVLTGSGDVWGPYTWQDQPRFYCDEHDNRYEYVYKVTEAQITLEPGAGSFTPSCKVVDGVHTFTNTYTPPTRDYYMKKAWNGGKPRDVTVQLQRKYVGEDDNTYIPMGPGHTLDGVPDAEYGEFSNAKELANWVLHRPALPRADNTGRPYQYRIIELSDLSEYGFTSYNVNYNAEAPGGELTPGGGVFDAVVINNYEIPKQGTATVKKIWRDGPTDRPDVYFQLWRKTTTGTDDIRQAVPGLDPIKINDYAGYEYTFTGLDETDFYANPYTFFAVEGSLDGTDFTPGDPQNYELTTADDSLELTNQYVIPTTGQVSATKTWVNGPDTKPEILFQLHRKTETGTWAPVPGADAIKSVPDPTDPDTPITVTWTGLETTDINGAPYYFAVVEGVYNTGNEFVQSAPLHYTATGQMSRAITNTYDPPADATFTATKTWSGGPVDNKKAVTLDLYRENANVQKELVTGVTPQITGQAPEFTYKWTNLVSRDSKGVEYIFSVKERDEDAQGNFTAPDGSVYKVSYDALKKHVTNTYQIPKYNVIASKTWDKGPSDNRPEIWFKLQRRITGGAWKDVPGATQGTYAEIKQVPAGLSVTWTGQERTDFDGNVWEYAVVEGNLAGDVFTAGVPENYELSGADTLHLTNTYVIPTAAVIAQKQWVDGPAQKPTVWFKLQRAVSGGQPEDIPAGEGGSAILKLLPGASSVQWDNVKQTDIYGKPYTFSIVEGLLNEDTQEFTPGLPESYEYAASAMSGALGVINTYTSPTESKTVTKTWAGGGPKPYPEIWLRLERTTSPTIPWEPVLNATPVKVIMPEGSDESYPITWANVALKDENAVPYVFRVTEGLYDEDSDTFTDWTPPNYKVIVGGDGPNPLDLTNMWQTVELSTEIVWDGEPAAAYDLPDRKVKITVYRQVGDTGEKEYRGHTILDGTPNSDALDPVGYEFEPWKAKISDRRMFEDDGQPITYIVEQEIIYMDGGEIKDYQALYTSTTLQTDQHWEFTNTFDRTTVEVFKEYAGTEVRPPVTIVLFQHSVEIENGVEVNKVVEFDRFELDGIPHGTFESGEPYEKERGLLIWPNLPIRTLSGADAEYSVTELIPEDVPFPYQRVITGNATDGFHITNTKNDGTFVAIKRWDIGAAPLPESVTFKLWRWVAGSGHHYDLHYKEEMPAEYDGVMDGTADADWGAHGKESKPWEYSWINLPLNGDYDNDPTQPVYYSYFVEEVPLGDDYVIDAVTSSSVLIKNIALKTQFTARKIWGGGPTPAIRFQLVRSGGTGPVTPIGNPVLLDGVADEVPTGESGELSPWTYTWTDLPRFEDDDTSKPYVYTAKEVNAAGEDFIPEDYDRYGNDSDRIINVHRSTVSAVKIWEGGNAQRASAVGPATYLTLYRRLLLEEPEAVAPVPAEDLGGQAVTKPVDLCGPDETPDRVTVTWTNMPWGNDEGIPYIYSVVETDSAGNSKSLWKDDESNPQKYIYNTAYNEDNPLEVTNTYRSPTREVTVNKFWHGVAQNETLPDVWLRLWRGLTADEQVPLTSTEGEIKQISGVQYTGGPNQLTWDAVDKFDKQGREYIYTVREYVAAYANKPGTPEGFTDTRIGLDLHNIKLISVTGEKVWADVPEGKTPPAISLQLLQNGTVFKTHGPVPGDAAGFSHTWSVPKYHVDPDTGVATECAYSVAEAVVPNGYTMTQAGNTITNTYDGVTNNEDPDNPVAEPVTINITKIWLDEEGNPETDNANLPESLPIKLTGTDGSVRTHDLVPDTEGAWKHTYTGLYKYDVDGEEIIYSLTETIPLDYTLQDTAGDHTTGFTLTNKHTPGKVAVQVMIDWDDANNQDGKRPEGVEIRIFADGTQVDSAVVTKADSWSHIFADLPQYEGGKEITYTIAHDSVASYTMAVAGYNVTYAYVPGKVSVPVTKVWDDNNDADGVRPQSVSIRLLAGGADTGKILTLSEENSWTGAFADLDEYAAGQPIVYAIEEVSVADSYKTAVTGDAEKGYIVTNSREIKDPEISDDEIVAVIFDPAGGIWLDASTGSKEIKDRVGTEITIIEAPTREGYEFQYWQGSQYQPGDKYIIPDGGHTFVAVWKEVEVTEPTDPSDGKIPSVGDSGALYLWFSLPILLAAALLFILHRREQKRERS